MKKVAVIGAGAAGQIAAAEAAIGGASITVYERNRLSGRKLRITGKGRCNVTNDCEPSEFMKNLIHGGKFMYSAINSFKPSDTIALFESLGVPLKTERGRRVFPQSDSAADIARALENYARESGAVYLNERVRALTFDEAAQNVTGVLTDSGEAAFDAVIIATGGLSYPRTGSDGDGYKFARSAGHTITPLSPSLVPLDLTEDVGALEGLSLKNVMLTVKESGSGRKVYSEQGEMLFTSQGISGPLVLSASAHMSPSGAGFYTASIDLKPALDEATFDRRILSDFAKYQNRDFVNAISDLLPLKMIPYIISRTGIDGREKVNSITAQQRKCLLNTIISLDFHVSGFRPIDEAVVTRGGIDTREVDPRTMRSKLTGGLYFAGEVLDIDAYTGGYNLQIAFSTGVSAGRAAAQ